MYLIVALLFHFHGDNRRYKFPQDNPTTHKTDTTRALTNKTLRFFATWESKSESATSRFLHLLEEIHRLQRSSQHQGHREGNPNAMQLWIVITCIGFERVEYRTAPPTTSWVKPRRPMAPLRLYMFFIIPSNTCLVSLPSADTSRSTVGPSISWCFIFGSSSGGFGLTSPLGVVERYLVGHVWDRRLWVLGLVR